MITNLIPALFYCLLLAVTFTFLISLVDKWDKNRKKKSTNTDLIKKVIIAMVPQKKCDYKYWRKTDVTIFSNRLSYINKTDTLRNEQNPNGNTRHPMEYIGAEPQYIYLLSDERQVKDDWMMFPGMYQEDSVVGWIGPDYLHEDRAGKDGKGVRVKSLRVIASNDPKLDNLPTIPEWFLKEYVEHQNKTGFLLEEAEVEMLHPHDSFTMLSNMEFRLVEKVEKGDVVMVK